MNIKQASIKTGVSEYMLRYYEKIGIILPKRNPVNHYRDYSEEDIFNIVMIKQYSELGISLKTIKNLINTGNIESVLEELNNAVITQKNVVEWSQARLENIIDFYNIFKMLHGKRDFIIKEYPVTYYYPKQKSNTSQLYSNLYQYSGAVKTIFRIKKENITLPTYPEDQGMLSFKKLSDTNIPFIEIPPHQAYCTTLIVNAYPILTYQDLKPLLINIHKSGFQINGDIILYKIMNENHLDNKITICVECTINNSN